MKEITIDGTVYVPKSKPSPVPAKKLKGMKYVIARSDRAGVFAGYLKSKEGQNAVLLNARRLWYWWGAASLSQLAMEGLNDPDNKSKFPCEVAQVELDQVIEVLDVTKKAQESINSVPIWKM